MLPSRGRRRRSSKREHRSEGRGWQARLLQFAIRLKLLPPDEETQEQYWLKKEERAPEWLELFYDLVIVAVLSVFSTAHEVSSPQSIVVYFSYFVIIWWVWAAQMVYDVHFQANDWLHRLFKCGQLGSFAFIGATAANFDPFHVLPTAASIQSGIPDPNANSFMGVAIAYAVGRLILVLQYIVVAIRLVRLSRSPAARGQRVGISWVLIPCCIYALSGVCWFAAAFLNVNATVKLILPYSGLALEILSVLVMPLLPGYIKPPSALIAERFGALTLIILGEGIIGLIRAFGLAIAGVGFTYSSYLQCFCALIIVFAIWHFVFHGLNTERSVKSERGAFWLFLHLPLHFVILLVLSGIKNTSVYGNIYGAVTQVSDNLNAVVAALQANNFTSSDFQDANSWCLVELSKLDLRTSYPDELNLLNRSIHDHDIPSDPDIEVMSYTADILLAAATSFDIDLSDEVLANGTAVINLNTTYIADQNLRNKTLDEDQDQLTEFFAAYQTEIAQGVLYFLPASGALVLLASALIILWQPPLGTWLWASWAFHVLVGIVLCSLGALDVGNTTFDSASSSILYKLLTGQWLLPIVAITYATLIMVEYFMLRLARRMDPDDDPVDSPREDPEEEDTKSLDYKNDNDPTDTMPLVPMHPTSEV